MQKVLSFQSRDASEVSPITVEALQYRINPCLHETEKQTVESLLYIPPSGKNNEGGGGERERERESVYEQGMCTFKLIMYVYIVHYLQWMMREVRVSSGLAW